MKLVYSLIVLLPGWCAGQGSFDSMKKYSYQLFGLKTDNNQPNWYPLGTCFFIRREADLLIVTAKHVLSGKSTFDLTQSAQYKFDTVIVKYFHPDSNKMVGVSLIFNPLRPYLKNELFYKSPDFIHLKVNFPGVNSYINSIEKFIDRNQLLVERQDSMFAVGYGVPDTTTSISIDMPLMHYKGVVSYDPYFDFEYPNKDSSYFIVFPSTFEGMSGSPVFRKSNDKKTYVFAGVFFGRNTKYGYAYVVGTNFVNKLIFKN